MEKRLALVIGNSKYDGTTSLANPFNDASDMTLTLEDLGFEVNKQIDLNHTQMVTEFAKFKRHIYDYDVSLLYFAGHGLQIRGENYLAPIDIDLSNEERIILSCININNYLNDISIYSDKTNIIILDSCRTNPFARKMRGAVVDGFASFSNAPKGTFISYSTSPDKAASDGTDSNGLYTGVLKHYIKTSNIKIEDTFKMVRTQLAQLSGNEQISWEHSSLVGDFYFKFVEHSNESIDQKEVFEYIETRSKFYLEQDNLDIYDQECLPILDAYKKYNVPIIEIMRFYSKESYERIGQKFSDNVIDEINFNYLVSLGFENKNYRWYYKNEYVVMGEPLPLDIERVEKEPLGNNEIDVTFKFSGKKMNGKVFFEVETNLPNKTLLMFTLSSKDNSYRAQSKNSVENGYAKAEGFTSQNEEIEDGLYLLSLSSPIHSVQPEEVKKRLGEDNRNLIGKYVEHSPIGGKTVTCNVTVISKKDEILIYESI